MTVSLKHAFTSAIPDVGDATLVEPSDWNAEHTLSMATGKMLGRTTAGTGAFEEITIGTGLLLSGGTLSSTDVGGTVTSVAALTLGTTGTDLSSTVATGTTTPVITLQVPTASATNRGALSAADWTTFNNKGSGTVTSVTGTAPVVSSGGATPAISMAAATGSVNGYLTSTDWTTFNSKQATITFGTGVQTALGVAVGSAGAPVLFNGAGGTPSSLALANATGLLVAGGGTGRATGTTAYSLVATGTTATGAQQTLANGATTEVLVGGGAAALPVWTTASGTGAPVRSGTPTLTTPVLTGLPTGTGVASAATASTLAARDASANLLANNMVASYATTATAAGTTTLTVTSAQQQFFTGATTQTVVLPVTSTLGLGFTFRIVNNSSGVVTVQSSGLNSILAMAASTYATFTVILASGTTAASWSYASGGGSGAGTVTSVGWTGGIVSVATATTTPAFTIAGTSGGIPYFSSASTWATSAALAANALVIGGGAGVAPATTTTGTGVVTALGVNVGSAGAFVTNGGALGTPSSGTVTNLTGTASININGTVGATTPASGSFTTITGSGLVDISGASAGQIKFPASQNASANANTLDDYEEGTWTPALTFGGGSTGMTWTLQVGWYTKVGNVVTAGWNLQTLTKGSSTGAATISGLPFSTANAMGGVLGYVEKLTSVTYPGFYINIGNPTIMNLLVDGVANSMTDTNFAVGANYIRGSFSYNT